MIIYVDDPEFCRRIRGLLRESGLSREEFCRRTGMSLALLEDIEKDRELDIPYEVLKGICGVFSLRTEDLLTASDE